MNSLGIQINDLTWYSDTMSLLGRRRCLIFYIVVEGYNNRITSVIFLGNSTFQIYIDLQVDGWLHCI